jgi:hypothetical protein
MKLQEICGVTKALEENLSDAVKDGRIQGYDSAVNLGGSELNIDLFVVPVTPIKFIKVDVKLSKSLS